MKKYRNTAVPPRAKIILTQFKDKHKEILQSLKEYIECKLKKAEDFVVAIHQMASLLYRNYYPYNFTLDKYSTIGDKKLEDEKQKIVISAQIVLEIIDEKPALKEKLIIKDALLERYKDKKEELLEIILFNLISEGSIYGEENTGELYTLVGDTYDIEL